MEKQTRAYGTWPSVITPRMAASGIKFGDIAWDTQTRALVWAEGRGAETALVVQHEDDAPRDLTEAGTVVRGGVGYGGGEFAVGGGWVVYAAQNRLYRQALNGGGPRPITPAFANLASPAISPDGRWVVYVYSYERADGLALAATDGHLWPRKLTADSDFAMDPVWHPSGRHIAYIRWNHPQMPWNGAELCLLHLQEDAQGIPYIANQEVIVGSREMAVCQPQFSSDGRYLAYASSASGWWQLYVYDLVDKTHVQLTDEEAEHAGPAWTQRIRTYGWNHNSTALFFIRNHQARHTLWRYDVRRAQATLCRDLADYSYFERIAPSPHDDTIGLIASSARIPPRLLLYEDGGARVPPRIASEASDTIMVLANEKQSARLLRRATTENIAPDDLADAQPIQWVGHDGETVHGIYYAPTSARYSGAGQPPLMVLVHGGPTSQRFARYDVEAQFFATRGWAVLQVNHRGSTGYGRAYMDKHRGQWGVYDVEDSASGARHLAEQGLANPRQFVIMGGSAGGFTVLQSLVEKVGFYRAGVCAYGVANQFLLAMDTHKFEERYSDWLLGPLPEAAEIWRARSPIFHADRISDPLILFQGEDDDVVPRNQSDEIVAALRARGVPHEYHVYSGEGHGWRKPQTIEDYYHKIERFLTQTVIYA